MKTALKLFLSFGFFYHGLWNLSEEARIWWQTSGLAAPLELRPVLGVIEMVLALGVWVPPLAPFCFLGIAALMIGAAALTAPRGFLYKHGGCEVPLFYAMLSLHLLQLTGGATRIFRGPMILLKSRVTSEKRERL
jgi:hypothetical protein